MKAKISILIIAHNEESHISECLESVFHQRLQADEIICVAHNCTDTTSHLIRKYPHIKLYELETVEKGPIPARAYGFEKCSGDIIACIDGDSYVCDIWLESIISPFDDIRVNSVSGYPILLEGQIFSFVFFLQGISFFRCIFDFYFWGANFACRKKYYESIGGMTTCKGISKKLDLYYPAEDCVLSFLLQEKGILAFSREARSYVYSGRFFDGKNRGQKQREDLRKIKKYFGK